jgi:hypothetical protein
MSAGAVVAMSGPGITPYGVTPAWCSRWPTRPTAPPWSPAATTARCGSGMPAPASNSTSSPATPGNPRWELPTITCRRAWIAARKAVLTPEQQRSPLARRIYDLRHACLSTWLNAGVNAPQVAEWAGHGVDVLLKIYAKCIDGQDGIAKRRIEEALRDGAGGEADSRDAEPPGCDLEAQDSRAD